MTLRAPCKWKAASDGVDYSAQVREHVRMLNALDAPFVRGMEQSAANGGGDARQRGAAPGLVPIENKSNGPIAVADLCKPHPRAVLIDPAVRRCRRMRTGVEHSMRLAEAGLARSGGFRFARKFITLTYRNAEDWSPKHVAEYVNRLRQWAKRRKFQMPYTWVAELQGRGALHYHLVVWVPRRFKVPTPDASGMWSFGSSNLRHVTGGCGGVMAYLGKYMSKNTPSTAHQFPKGARMFGAGGLSPDDRREIRYRSAPFWVRDELGTFADIRRSVGGWVDVLTGMFIRSPWKVVVDSSGLTWAVRVQ